MHAASRSPHAQSRSSDARKVRVRSLLVQRARLVVVRRSMTKPSPNRARAFVAGSIATVIAAGAGLVHNAFADGAAAEPPITPAMTYLANLPAAAGDESALASLFAAGTADHVPVGSGAGYPVLFHSVPELDWFASQLWGGKTFRATGKTQPNGDPEVVLDNKIIKTPTGGVFNIFNAYVTRGTIGGLALGVNSRGEVVAPPAGTLAPIAISFLQEPVVIDDKPSIILNYFEDRSLPVIRRILDEIREVDPVNCPGLYLGRAHARRCDSFACGEVPSFVDLPTGKASFATSYDWRFWTYFLLNFGQPAGTTCDLGPAIARAEQQLGFALPTPPAAR
jgi:hypothetical protein